MDRDKAYIAHMLGEIGSIEHFVAGIAYETFIKDEKTKRAVERSLEIIGEAAKNVSAETQAQYPNIPWRDISGLRDKIIHHYFDVDYATVWDVTKYDLPLLKQMLSK